MKAHITFAFAALLLALPLVSAEASDEITGEAGSHSLGGVVAHDLAEFIEAPAKPPRQARPAHCESIMDEGFDIPDLDVKVGESQKMKGTDYEVHEEKPFVVTRLPNVHGAKAVYYKFEVRDPEGAKAAGMKDSPIGRILIRTDLTKGSLLLPNQKEPIGLKCR